MRTLTRLLNKQKVSMVVVNQLISGPKGSEAPGGGGVKHHASQRIQLYVKKRLADTAGPYGIQTVAKVVKLQSDPLPGQPNAKMANTDEISFPIHFWDGPDNIGAMAELLLGEGVDGISRNGAWIKVEVNGKSINCYQKDLYKAITDNDLVDWMKEKSQEALMTTPRRDLNYGHYDNQTGTNEAVS
jgi:hypothetical protein